MGTHLGIVRITDAGRPIRNPSANLWRGAREGQSRWRRQVIVQANVHGITHFGANSASKLNPSSLLYSFPSPFVALLARRRQCTLARARSLLTRMRVGRPIWRQGGMRESRRCGLRGCHGCTAAERVLRCNVGTVNLRVRLVVRQRMVVRGLRGVMVWRAMGVVAVVMVVVVVLAVMLLHVSLLGNLVRGRQLDELWLEHRHQVLNAADVCKCTAQPENFLLELVDGPAIERREVVVVHGLQVGERRDERRGVVFFHTPIASGWLRVGFGWQWSGGFEARAGKEEGGRR